MPTRKWTQDDADALRSAVGQIARAGRGTDELARAQATVLGYLDRDGPLAITELAERAMVRHQSVRKTVAILERDGAITTQKSPADARKVICEITTQGWKRLERDRQARACWILDAVERRLDSEQQAAALQIAALLSEIAQGL